jgi:FkbM family methyltransferase
MLALLASSRYSRKNGWWISRAGVSIALENRIDFLTLYDLFVERHYELLEENAQPGSILWDIGANLGTVALVFAKNSRIAHAYAYEPMPYTVAFAERSLRLNPKLASKITLEKVGVGGHSGPMQINYTRKAKCAIGISNIPAETKTIGRVKEQDMETITIQLVDAAEEFRKMRARHPGAPVLLKLDAEGAEYQIIERLSKTGLLCEISAAAIEWHDAPGPEQLTAQLRHAGFTMTTKKLTKDGSIGMIQAWQTS